MPDTLPAPRRQQQVRGLTMFCIQGVAHAQQHPWSRLLFSHLPTASLQVWTFRELQQRCNGVAHWALAQDWAEGTVVALYMENRPLVVALWLGLAMVGAHQFQPQTAVAPTLHHRVWSSGASGWIGDDGG